MGIHAVTQLLIEQQLFTGVIGLGNGIDDDGRWLRPLAPSAADGGRQLGVAGVGNWGHHNRAVAYLHRNANCQGRCGKLGLFLPGDGGARAFRCAVRLTERLRWRWRSVRLIANSPAVIRDFTLAGPMATAVFLGAQDSLGRWFYTQLKSGL